ncbi:hypothetical protein STIAU_4569, partial [Stigmatella aurantiaca DW4/3-1]
FRAAGSVPVGLPIVNQAADAQLARGDRHQLDPLLFSTRHAVADTWGSERMPSPTRETLARLFSRTTCWAFTSAPSCSSRACARWTSLVGMENATLARDGSCGRTECVTMSTLMFSSANRPRTSPRSPERFSAATS